MAQGVGVYNARLAWTNLNPKLHFEIEYGIHYAAVDECHPPNHRANYHARRFGYRDLWVMGLGWQRDKASLRCIATSGLPLVTEQGEMVFRESANGQVARHGYGRDSSAVLQPARGAEIKVFASAGGGAGNELS